MADIKSAERHLAPVRKSIVVRRPPQEAFEIFTGRIGSWWPLSKFSIFQAEAVTCGIEPRVGGKVEEVSKSGERGHWGTIRDWDPPRRFVMSWHPGSDPETATELELRFIEVPEGTRVELEHRDWIKLGARAEETRGGYDQGWAEVFERCYAESCEAK